MCAPAHDQRRLRGYFTALTQQVLTLAFERATASGRPLEPPLLVVLDETAHIAPLAELDGLAATCASHGIQIVTIWQDVAQVRARYGARAPTVLNNHRAKVFLPGIADLDTLEYASRLIGDEEVSDAVGDPRRQGRPAPTTSTPGPVGSSRPRSSVACHQGRRCSSTARCRRRGCSYVRGGEGAGACSGAGDPRGGAETSTNVVDLDPLANCQFATVIVMPGLVAVVPPTSVATLFSV